MSEPREPLAVRSATVKPPQRMNWRPPNGPDFRDIPMPPKHAVRGKGVGGVDDCRKAGFEIGDRVRVNCWFRALVYNPELDDPPRWRRTDYRDYQSNLDGFTMTQQTETYTWRIVLLGVPFPSFALPYLKTQSDVMLCRDDNPNVLAFANLSACDWCDGMIEFTF